MTKDFFATSYLLENMQPGSFLKGLARIFDMQRNMDMVQLSIESSSEFDRHAVLKDWEAVGSDISVGMHTFYIASINPKATEGGKFKSKRAIGNNIATKP